MNPSRYRLLTLAACIGMFVVLIAGVLVTNTGSQAGCGTDWPLCNGKFLPAYTLESLVEYSHRFVTGIVGLLVGAAFLATLLWAPAKRKEPIVYASAVLFFTFLQAALGAMAVVWPQSKAVLALHFGISLFAFTSTWLLYAYAKRLAASPDGAAGASVAAAVSGADRGVSRSVYRWTAAILVYCYGVIYLGAYIRHTGSGGACEGWPLCNGALVPPLSGSTGIAFAHRLAALFMLLFVAALALYVRRRTERGSETARLAGYAMILVVLQVLSGGLLAFTLAHHDAYVFTGLLHTIIISALFSVLCLLALRARYLSKPVGHPEAIS